MLSADKLCFTKKHAVGDAKSAMVHANECFCCRLTEGPVLECSFCPNVFHLNCLPKGTKISRPRWGCPSHRCAACGAQTSTSRGKIYRCITCPSAYCFDHAPTGTKTVKLNPYEALGYTTKSFVFVQCGDCMKEKTIDTALFTESPLELELRFKSKGTGTSASHRKRSNSSSEDDEYEIEYPRKKQRTSPSPSVPVESVVAVTTERRRKIKQEHEHHQGQQQPKRAYDAVSHDQKSYVPQRPAYSQPQQQQQYLDAQVPLVPQYYSNNSSEYSYFRPSFGVMYYQPQNEVTGSYPAVPATAPSQYQHHAYNTPTFNSFSNGHTHAPFTSPNGTTRAEQQNGTTPRYDNKVTHMPELAAFTSGPSVTAHSNTYYTNISALNNPSTSGSAANNGTTQKPFSAQDFNGFAAQSYGEYPPNQNNSSIDIYNLN